MALKGANPKPDDGSNPIVTVQVFEPIFNQLRATWDPRGLDSSFTPPNGGTTSPDRYRTEYIFDYQEGDVTSGPIDDLVDFWDIDVNQATVFSGLSGQGITYDPIPQADQQGDMNGDGATNQRFGNVIVERMPSPQVFPDPTDSGSTPVPQIVETKSVYNSHSLPIQESDPEGNVTICEYYAENNPDGKGVPNPDDNLDDSVGQAGGGYLHRKLRPEGVTEEYGYDPLGRRTEFTNGRGFTWNTEYNSLDLVVKQYGPRDYTTEYTYDGNNNRVTEKVTNQTPQIGFDGLPTGFEIGVDFQRNYQYDILNRVVRTETPSSSGSLVTKHRYDKLGNLVLVLTPEFAGNPSEVVSTVYDERNLILHKTRGGLHLVFQTQAAQDEIPERNSVVNDPRMATETYDYNVAGQKSSYTDPEGNQTFFNYDGFNRLIEVQDPLNNFITFEWNPASLKVGKQSFSVGGNAQDPCADDSGGCLSYTIYSHDELGRVYQTDRSLFPIGATVPVQEGGLTPADGFVTERVLYDKNSRVVQTVDDEEVSMYYEYDGLNRKIKETDDVGNSIDYLYDLASNLVRTEELERDPSGAPVGPFRTWSFYDELDRLIASVDNAGHTTRYLYDSRGNLVFTSDPKGSSTSGALSDLDAFGEHSFSNPPSINSHGNTTLHAYDRADRHVQTSIHLRTDGIGGNGIVDTIVNSLEYDDNSRLKAQVDGNGNRTEHQYDPLSRRTRTVYADGTFEDWTHYRTDLVHTLTDANGTIATNVYDAGNRLISVSVNPAAGVLGTTWESYAYDGLDRPVTMSDNDSVVERWYDSLGRIVQEKQNGKALTALYDGAGNQVQLDYPGGRRIERSYDDAHRMGVVGDSAMGFLARYFYEGPSRVAERKYFANDTTMEVGYDSARRATSIQHLDTNSSIPFKSQAFAWDRAFNKIQRKDLLLDIQHDYEYDSSYQMIRSDRIVAGTPSLNRTIDYNLDKVRNRNGVIGGPDPGTYTMAGPPTDDFRVNQYTMTPFDARLYDANGNLVETIATGADVVISYDYRNRMVRHENQSTGDLSTYAYDVLGRRIQKDTPAGVEHYYYWGFQCLEERDSFDSVVATYVHGRHIDELLSMQRYGVDYFYHSDDLGNVVALTDSLGAVTNEWEYEDFGIALDPSTMQPSPSSTNPYYFQGHRLDPESGFYCFRFRYLDSHSGRFTVRDPLGIWRDQVNLGNGYAFAGNNPWTSLDSFGLEKSSGTTFMGALPLGELLKALVDLALWTKAMADYIAANLALTGKHEWPNHLAEIASLFGQGFADLVEDRATHFKDLLNRGFYKQAADELGNSLKIFSSLQLTVTLIVRPVKINGINTGKQHAGVFVHRGDTIVRQFTLTRPDVTFLPQGSPDGTYITDLNAFRNPGGDNLHFSIGPPAGMSGEEYGRAVIERGENYRAGADYSLFKGPNSNSAAAAILGPDVDLPSLPNAPAFNAPEPVRSWEIRPARGL